MTEALDDLPFDVPLTPPNPAAPKPKCRRHEWMKMRDSERGYAYPPLPVEWTECVTCGKVRDEAAARRGRNNSKRGKSIQRKRITGLGGQNLPGNKPNHDGIGVAFSYESKSGKAGAVFSEQVWRWLKGIPVTAMQTAVLIVTETPGPGRRARSYVVVDYDSWRDLHGEIEA